MGWSERSLKWKINSNRFKNSTSSKFSKRSKFSKSSKFKRKSRRAKNLFRAQVTSSRIKFKLIPTREFLSLRLMKSSCFRSTTTPMSKMRRREFYNFRHRIRRSKPSPSLKTLQRNHRLLQNLQRKDAEGLRKKLQIRVKLKQRNLLQEVVEDPRRTHQDRQSQLKRLPRKTFSLMSYSKIHLPITLRSRIKKGTSQLPDLKIRRKKEGRRRRSQPLKKRNQRASPRKRKPKLRMRAKERNHKTLKLMFYK